MASPWANSPPRALISRQGGDLLPWQSLLPDESDLLDLDFSFEEPLAFLHCSGATAAGGAGDQPILHDAGEAGEPADHSPARSEHVAETRGQRQWRCLTCTGGACRCR